ncbi:hypothetical protein B5566_02530 [Mycobacterium sp. MHSD3]|nr:hypothetical protein B5566_02530 [Mycobacterium sp. MHSD3]
MSTGEPRELRNKRIALEAINLLEYAATEEGLRRVQDWVRHELEAFRRRWEARGVPWVRPDRNHYDPDEWLTARDMAERADVQPDTVRRWHYRGYITSIPGADGRPLYNVGEVVAYQAKRATHSTGKP